jgi:hypothetical protein
MSAPTTHREALLAELLDDIGRLQERIDSVPDALTARLEPVEERVERLARALTLAAQNLLEAGNVHQNRIAEYVEKVAADQINTSADRAATRAVAAVRDEEGRALYAIREAALTRVTAQDKPALSRGQAIAVTAVLSLAGGIAIGLLLAQL